MKPHAIRLALTQGNVPKTYKFGLLYCGDRQKTEEEMYCNKMASDGFEDFLSVLGERVVMQGFTKFKGGLDTQSMGISYRAFVSFGISDNLTGTHSVFTEFEGHQVMFHVSTMLPFTEQNEQQV